MEKVALKLEYFGTQTASRNELSYSSEVWLCIYMSLRKINQINEEQVEKN